MQMKLSFINIFSQIYIYLSIYLDICLYLRKLCSWKTGLLPGYLFIFKEGVFMENWFITWIFVYI